MAKKGVVLTRFRWRIFTQIESMTVLQLAQTNNKSKDAQHVVKHEQEEKHGSVHI